jgi:hypothetical protein
VEAFPVLYAIQNAHLKEALFEVASEVPSMALVDTPLEKPELEEELVKQRSERRHCCCSKRVIK